jgi:hypothetical protein
LNKPIGVSSFGGLGSSDEPGLHAVVEEGSVAETFLGVRGAGGAIGAAIEAVFDTRGKATGIGGGDDIEPQKSSSSIVGAEFVLAAMASAGDGGEGITDIGFAGTLGGDGERNMGLAPKSSKSSPKSVVAAV